jgi:hypothetical protein
LRAEDAPSPASPSQAGLRVQLIEPMRRGKQHSSQVHMTLQASFCNSNYVSELYILYLIIMQVVGCGITVVAEAVREMEKLALSVV